MTKQRRLILEIIAQSKDHLTAEEIFLKARATMPSIAVGTVYRNLKALVDDGTLAVVQLPGENPRYEPVSRRHHHHFQCRRCQRVFDVHACLGDLSRLAPPGFSVEDHDLTLYGCCADCAGQAGRTSAHGHAHAPGHDGCR